MRFLRSVKFLTLPPNLDSFPQERLLYPPRVLYLTIHVHST
ncbi:hypothetical protein [Enterococcus phage vB_Efs25_KEN11]|uniref:Uncharacterized protein n=1 Tax=Enterococcus phage vB_Efs6_KEN16 TaxID=3138325 RepID=A0AAX4PTR0_9CAUD